jgi:predicted permease
LRQLFTEAVLVSLIGGIVGILCSLWLLRGLSAWQPFPRLPIHVPVNPDANVYAIGLLLSVASGLLFGAVPVRQVLRTDPYEIVKSGSISSTRWRIAVRELLLVAQIAICGVLVTSSMVAVRGLLRSLHGNFGFEPQNAIVLDTDLGMAGYSGERVPAMQKRLIDAMEAIPGAQSVGLIDQLPLWGGRDTSSVFSDETTDLRAANAAGQPLVYRISPEYFRAAGTTVLFGRTFTWHDDKDSPRVAVVNQEFARRIFGSVTGAVGRYYKMSDGKRIQVVGIVEDGKYVYLTDDPRPAMFFPVLQSLSSSTWVVVRSNHDLQQIATAMRVTLRDLDAGLPFSIQTWNKELENSTVLFGPRMATVSLGVLGVMGAMLSITGVFGMAAYSVSKRMRELGIRVALGASRKQVLQAALGGALQLLVCGSAAGLLLGILASRVLAFIVYQATPRDPLVLTGVVLVMLLLGLLATWIPAQRALSIDPLRLLREE